MKIFYSLKLSICVIIVFIALSIAKDAIAQARENPFKLDNGTPINIKAENLAILNKKDYAVFKNNVHVTQGEMQIWADEMHIYTYFDKKLEKKQIKKIECFRNVKFKGKEQESKSQEATYYVTKGVLELKKDVFLKEGDSTIQGENFIYEVESGKTSISNNPFSGSTNTKKAKNNKPSTKAGAKRVKAVLVPGEAIKTMEVPKPDALEKKFAEDAKDAKKKDSKDNN